MSEPSSEDLASRGHAIFERLRQQGEAVPGGPEAEAEADTDPTSPADPEAGDATAGQHEPGATPVPSDAHERSTNAPPPASPTLSDEELAAFTMRPDTDDAVPSSAPPTPAPALVRGPLPGADDLRVLGDAPPASPTTPSATPTHDPAPHTPTVLAETTPPAAAAPAQPVVAATPPPSFARPLPRIMAVANQKGGVGKTTTAVNLGACLADIGYRVLVVDLDPQGNASTGLGINIRDLQGSMYDVVLHDLPIEDCVEATSVRNLFCAPSSLDLAGAEIELVPAFSRELRLKRALEEVHDDYDFVLIDCPPSLGLLTVNGLAAATEVIVPIQCEYYALEGLGQLLRNVNLVQKNLNPVLEVSAIILVMYDARTKLADQVVTEVREHFGPKVCRNVVPRTVRLSEAPSFGQPIIAFDPSSRGAIAYRELAKEVSGGTPQRAR